LFIKSNTLSFSQAILSLVNYYLPGECIALSLFFLPSFPSLPPAIGKKISDHKKVFSFFVLSFFSYRTNLKNQKDIATEKEEKHKPGKLPLLCLPGVCDYLFFTGKGLNHQRWQIHEKVRK